MPCSIQNCNGTQGLKLLPSAISDSKRRQEWMRYCRSHTTQLKYPRVCMLHFSHTQVVVVEGKSYLKHDAVPDTNLPSSEESSDATPTDVSRPPLVSAVRPHLVSAVGQQPASPGRVPSPDSRHWEAWPDAPPDALIVRPQRRSRLKVLVKPAQESGAESSAAHRELHVNVVRTVEEIADHLIAIEDDEEEDDDQDEEREEEAPTFPEPWKDPEVVIYRANRKLHKPNTKGGVFYCPHCKYACVGPRILSKHVKRKHGHIGRHGRYQCDQCDYSTDHKGTLDSHLLIHSGARPHRCDQCGMSFRQRNHLSKHLLVHATRTLLVCDICGAEVGSPYSLARHRRLHFRYPRRVCEICGEAFPDDSNYSQHMRRKHMEWEHLCEVCSARFVGRAQLVDHMQTHTGERPFGCQLCELTFKQKTSLYQHRRRCHTHDFRIWCQYCEKGFLANRDLQRHVVKCARKHKKAGRGV